MLQRKPDQGYARILQNYLFSYRDPQIRIDLGVWVRGTRVDLEAQERGLLGALAQSGRTLTYGDIKRYLGDSEVDVDSLVYSLRRKIEVDPENPRLIVGTVDGYKYERPVLTYRQLQVLQLLAEGYRIKEAAAKLGISRKTVESHVGQISGEFDTHGIAESVDYATKHGLLPPLPAAPPDETKKPLSARELEVLKLASTGKADKEIAAILGISKSTAGAHINRILAKLDVNTRRKAVAYARARGLL